MNVARNEEGGGFLSTHKAVEAAPVAAFSCTARWGWTAQCRTRGVEVHTVPVRVHLGISMYL